MKKPLLTFVLLGTTVISLSQSTNPCISPPLTWYLGGNNLVSNASNIIGPCTNNDFILQANSKQSLFIKSNSYVGIGQNNSSPTAALDISDGSGGNTTYHMRILGDALGAIESNTDMSHFFGTGKIFQINEGSYNGAWYPWFHASSGGNIGIGTTSPNSKLTIDATGTNYLQATSPNGLNILTGTSGYAMAVHNTSGGVFAIWPNGRVALGNTSSTSAQLNVNMNAAGRAIDVLDVSSNTTNFRVYNTGIVYAREIYVQTGTFPDYVFKNDYVLPDLKEVKKYIDENSKLPNMPSAKQVESEGANLGEIQRVTVEKVEELFLYVIQLKEELDALKKENEELRDK